MFASPSLPDVDRRKASACLEAQRLASAKYQIAQITCVVEKKLFDGYMTMLVWLNVHTVIVQLCMRNVLT